MQNVTVFCASSPYGEKAQEYLESAYRFGRLLAENGFMCVNGGAWGLMKAVSQGAHEAGGNVHCVNVDVWGMDHQFYTTFENFAVFSDRQKRLIELGDAYVALPGGPGTHFEIFEVLVGKQIGLVLSEKPVLCVGETYTPLKVLLENMVAYGLAKPETLSYITFVASPDEAIEVLCKMR